MSAPSTDNPSLVPFAEHLCEVAVALGSRIHLIAASAETMRWHSPAAEAFRTAIDETAGAFSVVSNQLLGTAEDLLTIHVASSSYFGPLP